MGVKAHISPRRRCGRAGPGWKLIPALAALLALWAAMGQRKAAAEVLYVQTPAVNVREQPEKNSRIIALRYRGNTVEVVACDKGWCRVKLEPDRQGWIYRSALTEQAPTLRPSPAKRQRPRTRGVKPAKAKKAPGGARAKAGAPAGKKRVPLRYQYINSRVREYFDAEIGWLERELAGEKLDPKALYVSYREGSRTARLLLILPFDVEFYHESKGHLLRENSIDLLPFRAYLWSLQEYLERVAARAAEGDPQIAAEIRKFRISLVLQKEDGEEVVLTGRRRQSFVRFNPYIMVNRRGYRAAFIKAVSEEALEKATVFFLPEPKLNSGSLAEAVLLYDFFEVNY